MYRNWLHTAGGKVIPARLLLASAWWLNSSSSPSMARIWGEATERWKTSSPFSSGRNSTWRSCDRVRNDKIVSRRWNQPYRNRRWPRNNKIVSSRKWKWNQPYRKWKWKWNYYRPFIVNLDTRLPWPLMYFCSASSVSFKSSWQFCLNISYWIYIFLVRIILVILRI